MNAILMLTMMTALAGADDKLFTLIEFGWDEPDTAYLKTHAKAMSASAFDGTVFHANTRATDGKIDNFAWVVWGRRTVREEEVKSAIEDLKTTEFGQFRHNFLRFNTTPGKIDWFDDFSAILANARIAGRLCHAGQCRGILLDTEAYEGPLFNYRKQRDASTKTFDEYAEQAKKRGHALIEAFQDECPGLVVLMTFGPSYALRKSDNGRIPPSDLEEGLLTAFTKGLVDGALRETKIVDGYESSYGYRSRDQFANARELIRKQPNIGAGFGLWIDYDWREKGWNEADPSKNHFTPESFESSLRIAREMTDEFVWIYAENPRWWTADDQPIKLPAAYQDAIRRVKDAPKR